MEHSVTELGKTRQILSSMRNDKEIFDAKGFFSFAKQNIKKYHLTENSGDLLVNTWNVDALLNDYKESLTKDNKNKNGI